MLNMNNVVPPLPSSLHITIPRLFRLEFSIQCFISPVKPAAPPQESVASFSQGAFPNNEMLLGVRHAKPKQQEKPFSMWAWWIVKPHAGMQSWLWRGGRRGWVETAEGLPRALRSSSNFSLLFIFQVPAKLDMSAEAECEGCRRNLFHALTSPSRFFLSSLSLFDSFSPSSSSLPMCSCLLCSGLSLSFTLSHPSVSLGLLLLIYSHRRSHTHTAPPSWSVSHWAGFSLVFSSFIATVFHGSQRRSLPLKSFVPLLQ